MDAWRSGANGDDPLVPSDYFDYLDKLHVNWVGLSVALHYDDSMDSTIERVYSNVEVPTFTDRALRQLIREFRGQGLDVYLTLAFEAFEAETAARPVRRWQLGDPGTDHEVPPDDPARYGLILPEFWPWRPDHPDHQRFVSQFWDTYTEQAVHFATIAEEEGVRLYSLGTETDRLFRTRYGGHYWTNDFSRELRAMVEQVRTVYSGLLTYDMHYTAVTEDWFSPGSAELWEDLDLDVVGVSAWFPLTDTVPTEVLSVTDLRNAFDLLFQEHVVPLASRNTGRPVVFTEFGAVDTMEAPFNPADWSMTGQAAVYTDSNANGLDDGQETPGEHLQSLVRHHRRERRRGARRLFVEHWNRRRFVVAGFREPGALVQHPGQAGGRDGEIGIRVLRPAVGGKQRLSMQRLRVTFALFWCVTAGLQAQKLDGPLRVVHLSGNWGHNPGAVMLWEEDRTRALVSLRFVDYLRSVQVDWVGFSVALHLEHSMDSTLERTYSGVRVPTFSDDAVRQIIREFREHGFSVYMTLAIESFETEDELDAVRHPAPRFQLGDPGYADTGIPDDHLYCTCARQIDPDFWPWRPSHPDAGANSLPLIALPSAD